MSLDWDVALRTIRTLLLCPGSPACPGPSRLACSAAGRKPGRRGSCFQSETASHPSTPKGCALSPRPVPTAQAAGAQLARSPSVLPPPAASSLWLSAGYSGSARLAPSLPNPQRVVANVFGADTGDWSWATSLWTTSRLHGDRMCRSRSILPPSSSLTSSCAFAEGASRSADPLTPREEELCACCPRLLSGSQTALVPRQQACIVWPNAP